MKRIPLVIVAVLFSVAVLLAIRNRPRPVVHPTKLEQKAGEILGNMAVEAFSNHFATSAQRWLQNLDAISVSLSNALPALTMGTLTVDTLYVTNVDMVELALIEELGDEQGRAIYKRVTELARAHRETNRGVFPGATTNRVLVEFEEEP